MATDGGVPQRGAKASRLLVALCSPCTQYIQIVGVCHPHFASMPNHNSSALFPVCSYGTQVDRHGNVSLP